ncbi:MAG: lipoate--protein ligase [Candidatus Stygibacter australis]|nr:lipoate--protein ligase [Candidatus Stygibacter australis]MDP8321414.1 lipoate--protein ligase [Candidatus Stygibacter australis]
MLIIKSPTNDPYFNIASEEYILNNFTEDVFMLYINSPSIIVGKFQNTLAQLNIDYIEQNQIKVVRRLTGGGAVFHDLGNINFSFLCQKDENNEAGFEKYTEPIVKYLNSLGVNAELKGRNDLVIDDKKFSGNARLNTTNKVLQHGTLLFSAKMSDLSQALKSDPLKFKDKAVKSIRSRVTNISDHLATPLSGKEFEEGLIKFITSSYPTTESCPFTDTDIRQIQKLADSKYSTWDWNFGTSPAYNFEKTIKTKGGLVEIRLNVQNGIIKEFRLNGDFFTKLPVERLIFAFDGCRHELQAVKDIISKIKVESYLVNIIGDDLLKAFF